MLSLSSSLVYVAIAFILHNFSLHGKLFTVLLSSFLVKSPRDLPAEVLSKVGVVGMDCESRYLALELICIVVKIEDLKDGADDDWCFSTILAILSACGKHTLLERRPLT